jgi:hypothetical protein
MVSCFKVMFVSLRSRRHTARGRWAPGTVLFRLVLCSAQFEMLGEHRVKCVVQVKSRPTELSVGL